MVTTIGFYMGCAATLTGSNPSARGLLFLDGATDETSRIVVGSAEVGAGRVVFVTDSAIAGDGSDSHGNSNPDRDAWSDVAQDNSTLFLNAMYWLAGLE